MVGSALIARFSCETYSPRIACVPALIGEQPDIDANALSTSRLRCATAGDQCCSIGLKSGVDDRAAVEGADGKRDRQRLDQKTHADGRPAGDDGEADAAACSLSTAAFRASVRTLSFVNRVPSTSETTSAIRVLGNQVHLSDDVIHDSLDRRIDRYEDRPFVRSRPLQCLELAGEQARRLKCPLRAASRAAIRSCVSSRKTMRTSSRPCTRTSR